MPRLTIGRMMIAVAVIAILCFFALYFPKLQARRNRYLSAASESRRQEAWLRETERRFEYCTRFHGDADRSQRDCMFCNESWSRVPLKDWVRTPSAAAEALKESADTLGRWAERFEHAARTPWVELPYPSAAEYGPVRKLKDGDGPIPRCYFDAY